MRITAIGTCAKCHRGSVEMARHGAICIDCSPTTVVHPFTVKRVDIFGVVTDTHATEGELNGWRDHYREQARLL